MRQNLLEVARWCCEHKLLINPGKTKFLIIGTRQLQRSAAIEPTISFLGEDLIASAFANDLGVILDSTLSYDEHTTKLVSTCMSKLCQIYQVKDCFNKDTLKLIIESLVLSKLFYCSTVWANTSESNIKKLQLVQNFAARIITGARKYDHITPHLQELGWLPVKDHLRYRDLLIMFKCLNDMAPGYLSTKFSTRSSVHGRETRNMNDLEVPIFKTNSGQRTFRFRAAKLWNGLDCRLKDISSFITFKKQLKQNMLSNISA